MTKMKPNTLLKRTTLAVMLTSALLSGCSEKTMESHLADARNYASSQQIDAAIVATHAAQQFVEIETAIAALKIEKK